MRILVVDDDTLDHFFLVHMFEQQGYMDTLEAQDGVVAMELAKLIKILDKALISKVSQILIMLRKVTHEKFRY